MPALSRIEPAHPSSAPHALALAPAALHEIHAASHADAVGLSGLALMLGQGRAGRTLLWVRAGEHDREAGSPCPSGLAELGFTPSSIILVRPRDTIMALQAALEGARCAALAAVFLELRGAAKPYDLTASRRLAVAARGSGVTVLVARIGASPEPSAAETRWQIRVMPSRALPARAPGAPCFELTLLRARNGLEGARHQLEWDRDARQFLSRPCHEAIIPAPLSGPVVPLPFDRAGPPQVWREAG